MPKPKENNITEDIKPSVGHIPKSSPLAPPNEGKNTFKVELLVGEDRKLMLPFCQKHHHSRKMSTDSYIASPGLEFCIRVTFSKPGTHGNLYGGRVYIDSIRDDEDYNPNPEPYDEWSENPSKDHKASSNLKVDTSQADHYFWLGPGQTTHYIEGFYKSPSESQKFMFAQPSKKRIKVGGGGQAKLAKEIESIGMIRVMFCSVEKIVTTNLSNHRRKKSADPEAADIHPNLDHKIKIVTKPASVVRDGQDPGTKKAILKKHIIFERRLKYNAYEGYERKGNVGTITSSPDYFKGMTLNVLQQLNVRKQAINTFLRSVKNERFDLTQKNIIDIIDIVEEGVNNPRDVAGTSQDTTNDFVRVEDLVHFICKSLSPAGSYIICVGRSKEPDNYGEKIIQDLDAKKNKRFLDYATEEKGLVNYFKSDPEDYDLEQDGIDPKRNPKENFKVRFRVFDLSSDSDSSDSF